MALRRERPIPGNSAMLGMRQMEPIYLPSLMRRWKSGHLPSAPIAGMPNPGPSASTSAKRACRRRANCPWLHASGLPAPSPSPLLGEVPPSRKERESERGRERARSSLSTDSASCTPAALLCGSPAAKPPCTPWPSAPSIACEDILWWAAQSRATEPCSAGLLALLQGCPCGGRP